MTLRSALLEAHQAGDRARRGELVRWALDHGVTCRELAALLTTSPSTVFQWAGGRDRPRADVLAEAAPDLALRPANL